MHPHRRWGALRLRVCLPWMYRALYRVVVYRPVALDWAFFRSCLTVMSLLFALLLALRGLGYRACTYEVVCYAGYTRSGCAAPATKVSGNMARCLRCPHEPVVMWHLSEPWLLFEIAFFAPVPHFYTWLSLKQLLGNFAIAFVVFFLFIGVECADMNSCVFI